MVEAAVDPKAMEATGTTAAANGTLPMPATRKARRVEATTILINLHLMVGIKMEEVARAPRSR